MTALKNGLARRWVLAALGLAWLSFQLHILLSPQPPMVERPVHLAFALAVFLTGRLLPSDRVRRTLDFTLLAGVAVVLLHYLISCTRLAERMEGIDPILGRDLIAGLILAGITLECVRRAVGWPLLGVIMAFLAFAFAGRLVPFWTELAWLPELLKFSGFTLEEAVENLTLTPNGLLGITTATSANFVYYFVLFGAVYTSVGGGQLFIDMALRLAGRQRGGAAKAAVVSSSLMGSISGSAVANVATTGLFTIPLMRKAGYTPTRAAAIEAISSTGGQLMPPVMGVAAFVMAELLQKPYGTIALAGIIPAIGFYWTLFLLVDLHARKHDLTPSEQVMRAAAAPIVGRLYLLSPIVVFIALLVADWSASFAAVSATALAALLGLFAQKPGRNLTAWLDMVTRGAKQAAEVAIPIAAIGIIIEIAVQSGLVLKFSVGLIELGYGTTLGALFWIIIGCLIMGMGLPTVAAYIIGAILFVPAMLDLGMPELASHFFVMYYCVLSMITPPVALVSYTASSLASAPVFQTSVLALRLGLAAFVIPLAFIFDDALLAQGTAGSIVRSVLTLLLGTTILAAAVGGYWLGRAASIPLRIVLGLSAILLMTMPSLAAYVASRFHLPAYQSWGVLGILITGGLTLAFLWPNRRTNAMGRKPCPP